MLRSHQKRTIAFHALYHSWENFVTFTSIRIFALTLCVIYLRKSLDSPLMETQD